MSSESESMRSRNKLMNSLLSNKTQTSQGFYNYSFVGRTQIYPDSSNEHKNTQRKKIKVLPQILKDLTKEITPNEALAPNQIEEENEIKKLKNWESIYLHTQENQSKINISRKFALQYDSDKFLKEIYENSAKFNRKNDKLQEFHKKASEEQAAIFMQNLNFSKKQFNFDIFKAITKNEKQKDSAGKSNDKSLLDFLQKELKIENINLEGSLDQIVNEDYYRIIVKGKIKVENLSRKQILDLSHKIFEIKQNQKNLVLDNSGLSTKLNHIREEICFYEYLIESKIKKIDELLVSNVLLTVFDDRINSMREMNEKEFSKYKKNLNSRKEYLLSELKSQKDEFILKINEIEAIIKKNRFTFELYSEELKKLKIMFSKLTKEQRIYYLDLLKKGIDVRNEGLTWIIKRLIELDCQIESSMFPRFLDTVHIDYLINVSQKQVELSKLKSVLKILKSKQKESNVQNTMLITKNSFQKTKENFKSKSNEKYGWKFSSKIVKEFENIVNNYDHLIKITHDNEIEDIYVQKVVDDLRKKMKFDPPQVLTGSKKGNSQKNNNLNKNNNFEDIMILRESIKKSENTIDNLINEQKNFIKLKQESNRNGSLNLFHNLVYSALFGNSVIL